MYLSRGQRIKLSDLCKSQNFTIKIIAENTKNLGYDISCFGLDEKDQCSDDEYLIFYNQKKSPCNGIIQLETPQNNSEIFEINLSKLPSKIKKLVFTMTLDGEGNMSELKQGSLILFENGNLKGGYKFNGSDFNQEKSIMIAEIYFKDEWRFTAKGHGFNGGLSALLFNFGIEETKEESESSENINEINNQNNSNPNPPEKNSFSGFIKNILSAPFKYNEKKKNEIKQLNEIRSRELTEHNEKNAKESKFKELLIDYLSDGILTKEEMQNLQSFCKENNLKLQDCLTQSQMEIENFLHIMLAGIVSDNIVTNEEEAAINSVCYFLNPSFRIKQEIEETIKRVKILEKIRTGNIEPITHNGIITKISELVWYFEPNIRITRQFKKDVKFFQGEIIVTSERIVFKSHEFPAEILLKNILNTEVDGSTFFIDGKTNKSTFQFRLKEAEILDAYIEQAINKFHRKLNLNQTAKKTRTIPQDVKQSVWIRDKGQCVECDATEYLEFDHIIPFSKGGSNSTNNIQLLCRKCNLKKSDNI